MNDDKNKSTAAEKEGKTKFFKNSENIDKALQNFSKTTVEPPKKNRNWIGLVLLPIIIGVGLYLMVQLAQEIGDAGEQRSLSEIIANLNTGYLLITIAVLIAVMVLESSKYFIVTHAVTGLLKPLNSIKVAFVGKYYDAITPFSAGGQPMQIVYLHKKGHSAGTSSAIILIKYFVQMMCWVTICLLLMSINHGALDKYVNEEATKSILVIGGWIGWSINAILPLSIVLFAIFPKVTNKILDFFINIVINISWRAANRRERKTGKSQLRRKVKLVRRKRKWIDSANSAVKDFRSSFVVMAHRPLHFISLILVCICEQLLTWAFPFFILIAFDKGQTPTWELAFAVMTLNVYTAMAVTVVPTPGNSGLMETVMMASLNAILAASSVWVIVAWRMSTYYVYILVGIGITLFEFIRKLVRNRKQKKLLAEQTDDTSDKTETKQ